MEPSASGLRQVPNLRKAKKNQAPLRGVCREAQPTKRGMGQEEASETKTKL